MIIKIGNYYINPAHVTSVKDEPNHIYYDGTTGRFVIYTVRTDEDITVPYSFMTFEQFLNEWKMGI